MVGQMNFLVTLLAVRGRD